MSLSKVLLIFGWFTTRQYAIISLLSTFCFCKLLQQTTTSLSLRVLCTGGLIDNSKISSIIKPAQVLVSTAKQSCVNLFFFLQKKKLLLK